MGSSCLENLLTLGGFWETFVKEWCNLIMSHMILSWKGMEWDLCFLCHVFAKSIKGP